MPTEAGPTPFPRDLAGTGLGLVLFWGPGVLIMAVTGNLGWWPRTIGWTAGLLWLAAMCFWNSARCRRVHCLFTGPFFLAMAVLTLLVGFRIVWFGRATWNALGGVILFGGITLCRVPELVWGRYWRSAFRAPS